MPAFSPVLRQALELEKRDLSLPIDLAVLSERVIRAYPMYAPVLRQFLTSTGNRDLKWICEKLLIVVEHDSKVQDFVSIGHCGKLLSRLDYLERNPKCLGLPNVLFDAISLKERSEFFSSHNHAIDSEVACSSDAQELLSTEKAKLSLFRP